MGLWESFDRYAKEYDAWYEKYKPAYESELLALRAFLPENPEKLKALEIGAGTGRFASALGIGIGLEPARAMAMLAKQRRLEVVLGVAEFLPIKREQFDLVLIVTALSFFENPNQALREALRVLKPGGQILAGILDKDSPQGRCIESEKKGSKFSTEAHFLSATEVLTYLAEIGFENLEICQTLIKEPEKIKYVELPEKGHGKGRFAVISAKTFHGFRN
ncbi:ubiquinone/menaquinone biosynthesis methyltransferase [Methanosarcina barkeri str. Wiesmoor]|uniref:Ubiquinone/menaquinone biosynthesis methyltransferase n=2 Tax=Methanosarcina barkeri TaxID=2208 RepID=A0A0E3QLG1_METBA|nr:class I SAM-dependent methyltransferase [Methanosarcina barkeri]AKB51065.1 ubiquinone/menaquinone biosynthesis methyltransferase [Methanosarcina barkeri str. Wiesmoor]